MLAASLSGCAVRSGPPYETSLPAPERARGSWIRPTECMPCGELRLSIRAKLRKKLGKELGDTVAVHLTERLT